MLDKPMTRSETDSNALSRGRLTKRHETNYARQRDVRNVTYRRDGKFQSAFGRATVLSMRTRQMQDRVCFEMANIKQTRLKMEEKQENSLSDNDKELIKRAVLESATRNTSLTPSELAEKLTGSHQTTNH